MMNHTEFAGAVYHEIRVVGDGTMNLKGETPTAGYMVGGYSWSLVSHPVNLDRQMIQEYILAHWGYFTDHVWPVYLGWWKGPNGKVHLDISRHMILEDSAIYWGKYNREHAIYDLTNSREIVLNYDD